MLAGLAGQEYEVADAVYVLDSANRLVGVVPFPRLLTCPNDRPLNEVMIPNPIGVQPEMDQEQVAVLAIQHRLNVVPVTDAASHFMGVIPASVLLGVLWQEHTEDIHRLAGVLRNGVQLSAAVKATPRWRLVRRLPWLLVGLLGSVVATAVVARFDQVLEARLAVAFFIPAVVYLADAVGTQTEAIVVRYLAAGPAPLWRLLRGELLTGLLIGLCLGLFVFPATLLAFGDVRLAAAVTLAVAVAGLVASGVGLILPWVLSQIGKDPAFGSGPVATVIQDVLSLLIYFAAVIVLVQ
jgi:magnesium transporter